MLRIVTFFLKDKKLVPMNDFCGPVEDHLYIEGAIELEQNGKLLFSKEMVDLVDQLWAYLINGLEMIVANEPFSSGFPDQAIEFEMTPVNSRQIRMTVECHGTVSAVLDRKEALEVFTRHGLEFFERMLVLNPKEKGVSQLYVSKIKKLRCGL